MTFKSTGEILPDAERQPPPRVTLLISTLACGGAERVCVTLANGLIRRGWDVELLVSNLRGGILREELDDAVTVTSLDVRHARTALFKLARHLKLSRPPTVLVFNYQLAVLLVVIRMVWRLRLKIIARNINTLSQQKWNQKNIWHKTIVHAIVKRFYHKVDKVIAQSQGMRDDLIAHYAMDQAAVEVIYNPLNSKIEEMAGNPALAIVEKQDYLLCVGKLDSQKAFHFAIQAFSTIARHHPTMRLKIVGQGSLEQDLKDTARFLDVSDRIDFEGFRNDMISYYRHARATVLTSLYEGLPNVLLESIALGTPVVAFDCPSGPREIILDGVNGFLIEYLNVHALAEGLMKIIYHNPFDPIAVRESASRFMSERIIDQYDRLLFGVGAGR